MNDYLSRNDATYFLVNWTTTWLEHFRFRISKHPLLHVHTRKVHESLFSNIVFEKKKLWFPRIARLETTSSKRKMVLFGPISAGYLRMQEVLLLVLSYDWIPVHSKKRGHASEWRVLSNCVSFALEVDLNS